MGNKKPAKIRGLKKTEKVMKRQKIRPKMQTYQKCK